MTATRQNFAPDALRVLVVDDLRFMCIALRQIVEADGDMRVVGEARNGAEAVALARDLKPDIVTMDIEMPVMDGIAATRQILAEVRPAPIIIMVSSHTQSGAAATIEALRLGAADFVSKQSAFSATDLGHIDSELRTKIRVWADRRRSVGTIPRPAPGPAPHMAAAEARPGPPDDVRLPSGPVDLVAIAVSTGGPSILPPLLQAIGPIAPPIVIAQHMPEYFTACLAQSLSEATGLTVVEGEHRQPIRPGVVTILPGGRDALLAPRGGAFELRVAENSDSAVHPSADMLFESAAMVARRPVAVILTGMGSDGTRGGARFLARRLPVLAQRPDTCVVGGMPAAAIEAGIVSETLTLDEIAQRLRRWAALPVAAPPVDPTIAGSLRP